MSHLALLLALTVSPVFAGDDEPDDLAWEDDVSLDRGGVSAAAPDEDEPDEGGDEPDDDIDVRDVKRDPLPQVATTKKNPGEDEFTFEEPVEVAKPAPLPGPLTLDVAGMAPLADNYAPAIVAVERDAVVVELPVLVAKSRAGAEPFVLVGSVYAGATKVGEVRQAFDAASLAESGPTFAFLKFVAPVSAAQGELKLVVAKAKADGSAAVELFARTLPYALK